MTVGDVPEALDMSEFEILAADLSEKITAMSVAQHAMRDYQLDLARDQGFEAGVLAAENGVGRA